MTIWFLPDFYREGSREMSVESIPDEIEKVEASWNLIQEINQILGHATGQIARSFRSEAANNVVDDGLNGSEQYCRIGGP